MIFSFIFTLCCIKRRKPQKNKHESNPALISTEAENEPIMCLIQKDICFCDFGCDIKAKSNIANINLEKDKCITQLIVRDCMSINVFDCPKITKIPDMCHFIWLENIKIQHCSIETCQTYFPASLRNLEISYCGMKVFEPQHLSNNLAQLNLSFNKLKSIPISVTELYEEMHLEVNLKNNDFWFSMYSDLAPSMLGVGIAKELGYAYKMNMISTYKIKQAIHNLHEKGLSTEAQILSRISKIHLEERRKKGTNTANNKQNVHLTSIQDTTKTSIDFIMQVNNTVATTSRQEFIEKALKDLKLTGDLSEKIMTKCYDDSLWHGVYNVTFWDIFSRVMLLVYVSPYQMVLLEILHDELDDGIDTCLTGQIARMINTLNGFVDGIRISINKNEELANSIIALRKRYAMIYEDPDDYIYETVPAVWQLLEDMCIPEIEQMSWLEYV